MKSPPYNPTSNGQAERLVRTVKDVLKKFLYEPEVMVLDLEDQINLFLFNYRNYCLTRDGHYPSERIFSYTPKTIIDLMNPKKSYRGNLKPPPDPNDDTSIRGLCPETQDDLFTNLMTGDVVWYKNQNPHSHAKWIKADFIKRFSKNIFQVQIGSALVLAHRAQLRPHEQRAGDRPNVVISLQQSVPQDIGVSNDEEEEFRGFPEIPQEKASSRKRKYQYTAVESPDIGIRRSKRMKKKKCDIEFEYD